jgi:hypothetical protein
MKPFLDGAYDTTGSALCNRLNGRWEVGATLISRPVPGENGMLVVCASPDDEIDIDGKNVAIGTFTGFLSPGSHHVVVKAPGKIPHKAHVVVSSGERSTLLITLQKRTAPTYPGASDPIVRKAVSRMVIGVLDLAVRGMLAGGLR